MAGKRGRKLACKQRAVASPPTPAMTANTRALRLPIVDVLRGFAVAQMIVYHSIYDLNHFGWLQLRMLVDQPWIGWRAAIVTQFLLLVGVGLVLRTTFKPGRADFWRRWAEIAAGALLVSAGSWLVFGPRYIWFGILHFVAAALLIARPLVRLGAWNVTLGGLLLAFGLAYANAAFNDPPAAIVGLVTNKPRTEDYVPLLPWLGVVLIGAGLGSLWQRRGWAILPALQGLNQRPPRLLLLLGTWALTVYLVHQPVIMAILSVLRALGL
jgi:uncharacterized membrane protein